MKTLLRTAAIVSLAANGFGQGAIDVSLASAYQGSTYVSEAVAVNVTLSNASKKSVAIAPNCFARSEAVFYVIRPDQTKQLVSRAQSPLAHLAFGRGGVVNPNEAAPVTLQPGEQTTVLVLLAVDWSVRLENSRPVFDEPGKYSLSAQFGTGSLSNSIDVYVADAPKSEAAALSFLQGMKQHWVVYEPALIEADDDAVVGDLSTLSTAFPQSTVYSTYGRISLARVRLGEAKGVFHLATTGKSSAANMLQTKCASIHQLLDVVDPAQTVLGYRHQDILAATTKIEGGKYPAVAIR